MATLQQLSATILTKQLAAQANCPALESEYAFLAASIAKALNTPGFTSTADLEEAVDSLDVRCTPKVGSYNVTRQQTVTGPTMYVTAGSGSKSVAPASSGGGLLLVAAAAVALWLLAR